MSGKVARLAGVLVLCSMLLICPTFVRADSVGRHAVVGNDVFLEGQYLSVGISDAGSFGTESPAPAGFHPTPYYGGCIGLSVDQDGFDTGSAPRTGDFFLPGTPEERFNVGYIAPGVEEVGWRSFTNARWMGDEDVIRQSVSDLSVGNLLRAQWVGVTPDGLLNVTQVIQFRADQRFFRNTVTLRNVGSVPLQSVRYMRNVDPDQDEDISHTFTTTNVITLQQPKDGKALVRASGIVTGDSLFYYSADPRARVSTFGFDNIDPFAPEAYDKAGVYNGDDWVAAYGSVTEDQAISICADLGTLQPGQEQTFVYYTSLDAEFTDALEQIEEEVPKDGVPPVISLPDYGLDREMLYQTPRVLSIGGRTSCNLVTDVTDDVSGSDVSITLDGRVVAVNRQNGRDAYQLSLHDGANAVEISATDDAGNWSTLQFIIDADQTPPVVQLDATPPSTRSSSLTVSGLVTDRSGVRSVSVNGHAVVLFSDGSFSESVALSEGANVVTVEASDVYGNTARQELSVLRSSASAVANHSLLVVLAIGQRSMQVNGMPVALDAAPFIKDGRTLLPIRALIETLGGTVQWNAQTKTATVALGSRTMVLTVGSTKALVNGSPVTLDVAPMIVKGRTFLPLRAVAENLGLDLAWDAASQTISFTYWP